MEDGIEVRVPEEEAGNRLDLFLAARLDLSRGYIRRLLARGNTRLNGAPASKGTILRAGDVVRVPPFRHPREGPIAMANLALVVLREEGGLVAVDKPAGWPTHPLEFDEGGTVLNAALARYPEMLGIGEGGVRSGVVHRLDTGTSGVLVFAKEPEAWRQAREAFSQRRVVKRYVACVHGRLRGETEVVLRLAHRGPRVRVVAEGGREAITRVLPVDAGHDWTRVEVFPVTGLMHQIRATLAHLGHPVLGDALYGSSRPLSRHLLHAAEIQIAGFRASSTVPLEITNP
jgi:23S rRNA pseudouridine1911/1915/1917 synthase